MELQLKNIGMIKEANVKIDGLTVIAGENDTGKSTVGKAMFMVLYHVNHVLNTRYIKRKEGSITVDGLVRNNLFEQTINTTLLTQLIFDNEINGSSIKLIYGESVLDLEVTQNEIKAKKDFVYNEKDKVYLPIIIETPLVWNFNKFFNQMSTVESQLNLLGKHIQIDYPFLMKDLNFNLSISSNKPNMNIDDLKNTITSIINGTFKKDDIGNFYFEREGKKTSLKNTATGIKSFGILQVLLENNYLKNNTVLIFDEPEVHLHPEWQLKMAKIIVELVKSGVKIIVNSHSPYMIDALKYYSDKFKVNSSFYLAEKNEDETSTINNVTMDISPIFEKLAEPLERLHKMKLGLLDDNK